MKFSLNSTAPSLTLDWMSEESELLRAFERGCGGDQAAFTAFARAVIPRLRAYCSHLGVSASDRDDVVQQILMQSFHLSERFDRNRPLLAWLYRIAKNTILRSLRQEARLPVLSPEAFEVALMNVASASTDAVLHARELEQWTKTQIERLPSDAREILHLRFGEGLTYAEISAITGIGENTLHVCVHRILRKLRNCISLNGERESK